MRPNTAIGIVLVVLGVLALAYQGVTYTRQERVLDIGPVHATAEKHERIPIPPLIGGLVLWGIKDSAFPPYLLDRWRQGLPHAEVVEIAGAGHWPHEEEPELVVTALKRFLLR